MRALRVVAALAVAAVPASAQQPAPLFASDAPIRLTITAPLPRLFSDRGSNQAVPGTLTAADGRALAITLKLRGITRRTAEVCDFPPLRIDLTAAPPPSSPFAGQDRLKLVTHCRNAPAAQQQLLLEYAAYRMYSRISPRSFRVRLATIDYRTPDGRPLMTRAGFLIEQLSDVARRNGTRETRAGDRIDIAQLSAPDAARYGLFEHLIANHDWSMRAGPAGEHCCHNAELIGPLGTGSIIPIPYDFDFSGLVGAPYATPPDVLRISDVRQRAYRGYCAHNAATLAAARQLRALQPQILAVLGEVPGLEPATQRRAANFLAPFFAAIATDAGVETILGRCLN